MTPEQERLRETLEVKHGFDFSETSYTDIADEANVDLGGYQSCDQTTLIPIAKEQVKLENNELIAENVRVHGFKPKRTAERGTVYKPLCQWLREELGFTDYYLMDCFIRNNKDKLAQIIQDVAGKYKIKKAAKAKAKVNVKKIQWSIGKDKYNDQAHEEVSAKKYACETYWARKNRSSVEKDFETYIDNRSDVEWWYKNGDSGQANLGIQYVYNAEEHVFYPDWIVKYNDGSVGLYDTKDDMTATAKDIKEKAQALYDYCQKNKIKGGIIVKSGTIWKVHAGNNYSYDSKNLGNAWKTF